MDGKNTLGLPQTIRDGGKRQGRYVKVLNLVEKNTIFINNLLRAKHGMSSKAERQAQ